MYLLKSPILIIMVVAHLDLPLDFLVQNDKTMVKINHLTFTDT